MVSDRPRNPGAGQAGGPISHAMPMTQQDIRNHYETQWKSTSDAADDTSGLGYSDAMSERDQLLDFVTGKEVPRLFAPDWVTQDLSGF